VELSVRRNAEYLVCIDRENKEERNALRNQLVRVVGASLGLQVDQPGRPGRGTLVEYEMLNVRSVPIVPPIVTGRHYRGGQNWVGGWQAVVFGIERGVALSESQKARITWSGDRGLKRCALVTADVISQVAPRFGRSCFPSPFKIRSACRFSIRQRVLNGTEYLRVCKNALSICTRSSEMYSSA
jgi:hypothetical protein